mmetsp:Transcript_25394/g.73232  ORF Transcript_25394/g.73232 Transcript_25394/m.73232 type:complete len:318 (+) Transcript_25394:778-1731(+)
MSFSPVPSRLRSQASAEALSGRSSAALLLLLRPRLARLRPRVRLLSLGSALASARPRARRSAMLSAETHSKRGTEETVRRGSGRRISPGPSPSGSNTKVLPGGGSEAPAASQGRLPGRGPRGTGPPHASGAPGCDAGAAAASCVRSLRRRRSRPSRRRSRPAESAEPERARLPAPGAPPAPGPSQSFRRTVGSARSRASSSSSSSRAQAGSALVEGRSRLTAVLGTCSGHVRVSEALSGAFSLGSTVPSAAPGATRRAWSLPRSASRMRTSSPSASSSDSAPLHPIDCRLAWIALMASPVLLARKIDKAVRSWPARW